MTEEEQARLAAMLMGVDYDAQKEKRTREFVDYSILLDLLTDAEYAKEIVDAFGSLGLKQTAIVWNLWNRIRLLEGLDN